MQFDQTSRIIATSYLIHAHNYQDHDQYEYIVKIACERTFNFTQWYFIILYVTHCAKSRIYLEV